MTSVLFRRANKTSANVGQFGPRVASHGVSQAKWVGIRKTCKLGRLQGTHGFGVVEPDVFVELLWQIRLKVVALQFGLRTVDHADGPLESRPR